MTDAEKFAEALAPQPKPLYRILAGLQLAIENCKATHNEEWLLRHNERYYYFVAKFLEDTTITCAPLPTSTSEHLKFNVIYIHTHNDAVAVALHYKAFVKPSLYFGFKLYVRGGRNSRNGHNDYLHEVLHQRLSQVVPDA